MRDTFVSELTRLGLADPAITLVTGDLGFNVLDEFRDALPRQFYNLGVAEQAMASACAGMAAVGCKVFMYSIVNFATFRCLEQIRNDIAYHSLDVCVVAIGAGTSYGSLGYTHHGLEDVAVMRSLPNFRVFTPADSVEVRAAIQEIYAGRGPVYLRLGHEPTTPIHRSPVATQNHLLQVREGSDIVLMAAGPAVETALGAAAIADQHGISVRVISCLQLAPMSTLELIAVADELPIVTLEDHSVVGGLGTVVLETLSEASALRPVRRLGYRRDGLLTYGSQAFLRDSQGLTAEGTAAALLAMLKADDRQPFT